MANTKILGNLLEDFVCHGLPGRGLQICKNGETIYEGYAGYSDIEKSGIML